MSARMSRRHQEIILILFTIFLVGLLYGYHLDGWLINDDEGSFLYQAWRVSKGDRPYADFFTSRWPLFVYTSGMMVKLTGHSIWAIRVVSVVLTLSTAALVFLLARRYLPFEGAWLSMLVYLLHPQIFLHGRLLYPEPFMLFFALLGLLLFERGWNDHSKKMLAAAGLSFGVATLYKLLGVLPLFGCLLWILLDTWQERANWRARAARIMLLLLPYGALVSLVFLGFALWEPAFYPSVIGVNLAQGKELSRTEITVNGLAFLLQYLLSYLPLMVFVLPVAWSSRQHKTQSLPVYQLATALAFIIIARNLFMRHLLYLIPSFAILFALALEPLRQWKKRSFLFAAALCAVLLPWVLQDTLRVMQIEQDTQHIVKTIRHRLDKEALLLSDYQELNFHSARQSTYLGAEISHVVVKGAHTTGEQLIAEMERYPVKMVILDMSPITGHHMKDLIDFEELYAYVRENFELLGEFSRSDQQLEIFFRDGSN